MRTQTFERLRVPITESDHIQGAVGANSILLEYGDYECPACGEAHHLVKAILESVGDRVCFTYRHFPLTNVHPHAQSAAEAAEAAHAQGAFWEMHDRLFENQEALEYGDLTDYAEDLGLDSSRLINEVLDGVYAGRVQKDLTSGVRSGVDGTPTFFINGVRYDGPSDLNSIVAALAYAGKWWP